MANDAVAKFNALMQEYVDKSYDELFEIASQSLSVAMDVFNKVAKDGNGAPYVVLFIASADKQLLLQSRLGYRFCKGFFFDHCRLCLGHFTFV